MSRSSHSQFLFHGLSTVPGLLIRDFKKAEDDDGDDVRRIRRRTWSEWWLGWWWMMVPHAPERRKIQPQPSSIQWLAAVLPGLLKGRYESRCEEGYRRRTRNTKVEAEVVVGKITKKLGPERTMMVPHAPRKRMKTTRRTMSVEAACAASGSGKSILRDINNTVA